MRLLLCSLVFLFAPYLAFAQFSGLSSNLNEGPSLVKTPLYPSPGEQVTLNYDDYRSSVAGARLIWFYNNTVIADAENQRTVSVTAPAVGESVTIKVALDIDGGVEIHTTTIAPLYLDIIIEPQTHVPGFYLGRALPSVGSQVKATALLNNGRALGNGYIYTWRINDSVFNGGPLRDTNKIEFTMPLGSASTISLQVTTYDGVVLAKRSLILPSAKPELYFYEINSLYGLETKELRGNFNLISNSATIRTEPYYLSSQVFNNPSILKWTINSAQVSSDIQNPYEVTLSRTGEIGSADLGFHVRSTTQLLQGVKGDVNINP